MCGGKTTLSFPFQFCIIIFFTVDQISAMAVYDLISSLKLDLSKI